MRRTWLSIFVLLLWVSPALGQKYAPVWESYLPQFSIYHNNSNFGRDAITIDFLFKKNGGPVDHTEHQAYILVYLQKDEEQILKLAGDSELVKKQNEKAKLFLDVLVDKKLVVPLESQVAKLNSPGGITPRFPDVRGNPRRSGIDSVAKFSFHFTFTFTYETLWQSVRKLGNSPSDVTIDNRSTWFNEKFKFLIFVPVNDSAHATKVSPKIRQRYDFAAGMDSLTALLYFRPLPYELSIKKFDDNRLVVYIN